MRYTNRRILYYFTLPAENWKDPESKARLHIGVVVKKLYVTCSDEVTKSRNINSYTTYIM